MPKLHAAGSWVYHTCILIVLFTLNSSCGKDNMTVESPIPDKFFRVEVNLNTVEALPLRLADGNFIKVDGGWRGIYIYRVSAGVFKAFDANCPYNWTDSCANIKADASGLFLRDSCCGSTFNWQGLPTGGPARFPMKQYPVGYLNSNTLVITNSP